MKFYYKMRKKRPDLNAMYMLKEKQLGRSVHRAIDRGQLGQLVLIQRVEQLIWNIVYSQLREDLW